MQNKELSEFAQVAFMPLSRVLLEHSFTIDQFHFYPLQEMDFEKLNISKNATMEEIAEHKQRGSISNTDDNSLLRQIVTSATGFSKEVLGAHPVVAFPIELDINIFIDHSHQDDVALIKKLAFSAERAMDIIRFEKCRLDLPDTLPGPVGSWSGSGDYLGAVIYDKSLDRGFAIAGSAIEATLVVKGIGLDVEAYPYHPIPNPKYGELASYAYHSLMLLTDAMSSPNSTVKFVRVMGLLEFLASPNEYQQWKKIKGDIACHIAKSKNQYHQLLERFKVLTSIKDSNGEELGYRTLIVHQGQYLPDLVGSDEEVKKLFRELQQYVSCIIQDMLNHPSWTWGDFSNYRESLKVNLGVKDSA